jgi:hypothetical protein
MLLEEVYELLEAIDQKDDHALQEELGDVLLHIIFMLNWLRSGEPLIFGRWLRISPRNSSAGTPTYLVKSGLSRPSRFSTGGISLNRRKNPPAKAHWMASRWGFHPFF